MPTEAASGRSLAPFCCFGGGGGGGAAPSEEEEEEAAGGEDNSCCSSIRCCCCCCCFRNAGPERLARGSWRRRAGAAEAKRLFVGGKKKKGFEVEGKKKKLSVSMIVRSVFAPRFLYLSLSNLPCKMPLS